MGHASDWTGRCHSCGITAGSTGLVRVAPGSDCWLCRHCDISGYAPTCQEREAAALLGRRGGLKGGRATGACKIRGDSAHYRALRAKAPVPQVYESKGEWSGYTVREGRKGWIVDVWSRIQGGRSGERTSVPYDADFPRAIILTDRISDHPAAATWAEYIVANKHAGRLLRRGHVVR